MTATYGTSTSLRSGTPHLPSGILPALAAAALGTAVLATALAIRPAAPSVDVTNPATIEQSLVDQRAGERDSAYGITSPMVVQQALIDHRAGERDSQSAVATTGGQDMSLEARDERAAAAAIARERAREGWVYAEAAEAAKLHDDPATFFETYGGGYVFDDPLPVIEPKVDRFKGGWR